MSEGTFQVHGAAAGGAGGARDQSRVGASRRQRPGQGWDDLMRRVDAAALFGGAQAAGGVDDGGFYGFKAYCKPGQHQSCHRGKEEYGPAQLDVIGKAFQPAMDGKPGKGNGYNDGYKDQAGESCRQEIYNIEYRSSQHFSYADLLGALLGHKGGETVEAEAGDEDGQKGE